MKSFSLNKCEEHGTTLAKTYYPAYKHTFKWMIEDVRGMDDLSCIKSPEFHVDPESTWHAAIQKKYRHYEVILMRSSKILNIKVRYYLNLFDGRGVKINNCFGDFTCSSRTYEKFFYLYRSTEPSENKLLLIVTLEVISPEKITKLIIPPLAGVLEGLLPSLGHDMKELFEASPNAEESDERTPIDKSSLLKKSALFGILVFETTARNGNIISDYKELKSFMFSELMKNLEFDEVVSVYHIASKYSMADLEQECKRHLFSAVTPDNVGKIVDLLCAERQNSVLKRSVEIQYKTLSKLLALLKICILTLLLIFIITIM